MKKTLYLMMLLFCFSIVVVSCKEKEKGNETETESNSGLAADKAEIAMNNVYQCPMDCEKGKTYDKEGSCPVCNMNLKKIEKENDADEDNKMEHSEDDGHNHN